MAAQKLKKIKPLHKTPVKEIPKPALDFDRDKNLTYLPQDESLDPLLEYPIAFEADIEKPEPENDIREEVPPPQGEILSDTKGGFIEGESTRPIGQENFETNEPPLGRTNSDV